MNTEIREATKRAVAYLKDFQQANGNFQSQAGPEKDKYTPTIRHSSIFFTSLIAQSLSKVPGTVIIRRRAIQFLLTQKNEQWSWNYWQRDSRMSQTYPYPDDLDDTFCALIAIHNFRPDFIDGTALARISRLLISAEVAPGGPYRTWLLGAHNLLQWSRIDVAVNANIGYFLSEQGVSLPGIEKYISQALRRNELASEFYLGILPSLYFIARWYHGTEYQRLKDVIHELLADSQQLSDLELGMLLSTGCRLNLRQDILRPLVTRLLAHQHRNNAWPPAALYRDPQIRGINYVAGSAALTTAFVVEALNLYHTLYGRHPAPAIRTDVVESAYSDINELPHEIRTPLRKIISQVSGESNQQITALSQLTAAAFDAKLSPSIEHHLNLANLFGWAAYTIYDDFYDQEGIPSLLGAANAAHRLMLDHFQLALPGHHQFNIYVRQTLDRMDAANTWESIHARATLNANKVKIRRLPAFKNYDQLANRSWGHVLAPVGSLVALNYAIDGPEVLAMTKFFKHFLIAKQLNDDAHDWEKDLQQGRITSVVSMLLAEQKPPLVVSLATDLQALRLQFWQNTIVTVAQLITEHCQLAKQALETCSQIINPQDQLKWLEIQLASSEQALKMRSQTYQFINEYGQH